MKDFSNAVFAPEVIEIMTTALDAAVATLPEPVHSAHVTIVAESVLRTANTEAALERIALMQLRLTLRRRRDPPATGAPSYSSKISRNSSTRSNGLSCPLLA